jgi:glycosyltransferase involved in cell wall biosynthesis
VQRFVSEDLAILIPVLGRPHRVEPVLETIEKATPGARVLILADANDRLELAAVRQAPARDLRVELDIGGGNYARKINRGVGKTSEPFIFTAADDLEPRPGWFEAARKAMKRDVAVVGVNDLIQRRRPHATHFLMTRAYAQLPTIDGRPGPFYTGYSHWNCDDELIATAKHRGVYAYAAEAKVLHLHPMAKRAPDDRTYQRGRVRRRQDRKIFESRRHLWT